MNWLTTQSAVEILEHNKLRIDPYLEQLIFLCHCDGNKEKLLWGSYVSLLLFQGFSCQHPPGLRLQQDHRSSLALPLLPGQVSSDLGLQHQSGLQLSLILLVEFTRASLRLKPRKAQLDLRLGHMWRFSVSQAWITFKGDILCHFLLEVDTISWGFNLMPLTCFGQNATEIQNNNSLFNLGFIALFRAAVWGDGVRCLTPHLMCIF